MQDVLGSTNDRSAPSLSFFIQLLILRLSERQYGWWLRVCYPSANSERCQTDAVASRTRGTHHRLPVRRPPDARNLLSGHRATTWLASRSRHHLDSISLNDKKARKWYSEVRPGTEGISNLVRMLALKQAPQGHRAVVGGGVPIYDSRSLLLLPTRRKIVRQLVGPG